MKLILANHFFAVAAISIGLAASNLVLVSGCKSNADCGIDYFCNCDIKPTRRLGGYVNNKVVQEGFVQRGKGRRSDDVDDSFDDGLYGGEIRTRRAKMAKKAKDPDENDESKGGSKSSKGRGDDDDDDDDDDDENCDGTCVLLPSESPSSLPSSVPSLPPSLEPSAVPSRAPSNVPSSLPTVGGPF